MEYIIGLVLSLLGALLYTNTKRKSAEALLSNSKTKDRLNEEDKDIAKNSGLLEAEVEKRKEIEKRLAKGNGKDATEKDIDSILDPKRNN